jgi:phasin
MTVKTTVPTSCTHPFPNISARRAPLTVEARGFPACEKSRVLNTKRYFMTVTHNPQAAAEKARAAYRSTTDQLSNLGLDTAVPEGVRALAEKTVAQTRVAYDRSLDAFDASLTTFERTCEAAGQGAAAFNRKIVDIARRKVDVNFDLAKSLASAKNLADIVELQAAFWRKQFGVLTAQAEEVRALSTKVTADMAKPIKSQMASSADGAVKAH